MKFYNLYKTIVVSIVSRRGLRIEAHHRNQPYKNKVRSTVQPATFTLRVTNHLKHLYISKKTEPISYKVGCGIRILRHLKQDLTWAIDKQFHVLVLVIYNTKEQKKSAIQACIAMWSIVNICYGIVGYHLFVTQPWYVLFSNLLRYVYLCLIVFNTISLHY